METRAVPENSWDPRNRMVRNLVRGKSFADVGGLFGMEGEKISVAHDAGAAALTMIDLYDARDPAWDQFKDRMRTYGINPGSVRCISGDFLKYAGEPFDVIHSSGILYHLPNPFIYLDRLRGFAREKVLLSSLVTPERIENQYGVYELPRSGMIFVPALAESERLILNEYWKTPGLYGVGVPSGSVRLNDFGTTWWLPTRRVLRKMCEVTGFTVEDQGEFWNGNVLTLQLAIR